jgi:hypothetical protein
LLNFLAVLCVCFLNPFRIQIDIPSSAGLNLKLRWRKLSIPPVPAKPVDWIIMFTIFIFFFITG